MKLVFAIITSFMVGLIAVFLLFAYGQDEPKYSATVNEASQLVFRGCIRIPPLPHSVEQFCVVEDTKTHIRFVVDEIVAEQGFGVHSVVAGQGYWSH